MNKNHKLPSTKTVLEKYDDKLPVEKQKFVTINKIVVPTEYDKQQLLAAFEYIHNLMCIDTGYHAVNTICHMYECPFLIEVKPVKKNWYENKKLMVKYKNILRK